MNCMQPTQKICRTNNEVSENCSGDEHCRDFDHHFRNQICHRALVEFQTISSKPQNTKGYNTEGTEGIAKLAKNCRAIGALMSIVYCYCWLCIIVTPSIVSGHRIDEAEDEPSSDRSSNAEACVNPLINSLHLFTSPQPTAFSSCTGQSPHHKLLHCSELVEQDCR